MAVIIAFNKPYEVLCQFTDRMGRKTLKEYINIPNIYTAGRLDYRSEGLLLLSDSGEWIHRITSPKHEMPKTYFVQVEGVVTVKAIEIMKTEILLPGIQAKLASVEGIQDPNLPNREKPVRDYHPTSWLKVILQEGKKHQVRRMTAAVGYPTLRLIRVAIGNITLGNLKPGQWRRLTNNELK